VADEVAKPDIWGIAPHISEMASTSDLDSTVGSAVSAPEVAIEVIFKAELYQAILACARKYKPEELEILLNVAQSHVSELLNGKIGNMSIKKLLSFAGNLRNCAKGEISANSQTPSGTEA